MSKLVVVNGGVNTDGRPITYGVDADSVMLVAQVETEPDGLAVIRFKTGEPIAVPDPDRNILQRINEARS